MIDNENDQNEVEDFLQLKVHDWKSIEIHFKCPDISYKGQFNHLIALFYIQSNAHFLAASAFETIILQLMQRKPSKFIFSFFRVSQKMNEKMFSAIMIFDF